MIKREVIEKGLVADLFYDVDQPGKVIIMLGGSEGGKIWSAFQVRRPMELLIQRGYAILSLAYFKAHGLPETLEEIPLEYFERAFAWLSSQSGIIPDKYAVLGGSKGAEAALLLGSRYPMIKVVVTFSPSSVVWQGIPKRRFDLGRTVKSSWSYQGRGLPFLTYPTPTRKMALMTLRLRKMHEDALQDRAQVENATIHVENIQGAILLISGKRDSLWPSTYMSEKIMMQLRTKDFKFQYEHLAIDTSHNGLIINRTCWRKVFDFLEEYYV